MDLLFLADWLNLLLRWAHLVVGIGWIGTSFYFMWLDYSLQKRERMNPGVYGTSWMVHGGGFYHVEKYTVAPGELPPDLHWFRWEAYLTWVTGFALLVVQFYWNASAYLIDRNVMALEPWQAVAISVASLAAGWFAYAALCRSRIGQNTPVLAVCVFAMIVGAAWFYGEVFSGRGALIHVGAFVGTMMAANVFAVIVPNQKIMVGQLMRGETPDGRLGAIGKQRSTHNNYLTLPVLVMMVSGHYPFLTSHPHPWLVVALILIAGGMIRHYINAGEMGQRWEKYAWTAPVAAIALLSTIVVTAPRTDVRVTGTVPTAEAVQIAAKHCATCHARRPTHDGFNEAPKGIALETAEDLRRYAALVIAQAVTTKSMPMGDETVMTDEERARLGAWLRQR